MIERACQFGPERQLVGALTEPEGKCRRSTVVLVSAGVTPKCGPFRLYTELARRLASVGFRTLRFDLGGIGDSGHAFTEHALKERTRLQIGSALAFLHTEHEAQSFVLSGLCSGADDSFRYAEHDPRVTGLALVDPFAYRAGGFGWRHLAFRARRRLLRAAGLFPARTVRDPSLVDYEHVPRAEASRILEVLLARRVAMHFVYTGGMREHFNHRGQLQAMFPKLSLKHRVDVSHLPWLDHTQLHSAERERLIETLVEGLRSREA